MRPHRSTAAALGILFIAIMVTWSLGFWLVGGVLDAPTYLADAFPRQNRLALGALFELVEAGAVLAVIAVVFPLMKRFSETLAVWYLVFRVLECVMLVVGFPPQDGFGATSPVGGGARGRGAGHGGHPHGPRNLALPRPFS